MKNTTLISVAMTGLLFLLFSISFAQRSPDSYDLLLKFGNVNLTENAVEYIESFDAAKQQLIDGHFYKIVQFHDIPSPTVMKELEASGLQFLEYIPNKAYIMAIPKDYNLLELLEFAIRNISDIIPEYKQDMYLLDKNYPEWALRGDGQIDIVVTYYSNLPLDATTMELSPLVREVIQTDPVGNFQVLRVDVEDIDAIVTLPQVYFVEPFYPDGEPENYTGKTLHRSNVLDSQYETGRDYDGTDVKVMLQDDGIIGPHIDYQGRIGAQNLSYNYGNHGDHCAGTIFGSGNLDPTAAGMAPGAELHTWGASPGYAGFNDIANAYTNTGIRISSTSYSDGCNAGYTSLARTMDIQVYTYESLMHVFSAGNAGTQNCGYGAGSGWGNITGGHKIGKNVIATANLNLTGGLSGSSSRGPAHDGRIKPDISAKGTNVVSTIDPNDYASFTGTSMACPGIAGSLAQLYQAYKELNGGIEPPGGLMKGLILNTADDLGNIGPDFLYGWGHINNLKAVVALENETYMSDEVSQGETNTHILTVPDGVKEIKVMVYWTDKEASVNASVALVNNLDITLADPDDEDHYPWVLNHYPDPDSLSKPAEKGIDALNNMEQVQIDDPEAGTYTLNVAGTEVPFGPQEYFMIYQFIYEDIQVTYPLGGESFDLGEQIIVRWDAHGDADPFTMEYTLDGGSTWELASDNIPGNQRYYYWTAPSTATGNAWVRISRSGQESMSETSFSLMGIPDNIYVARACEESVLLRWDLVDEAESYDVYILGEKYMDLVGSTSNDSLFIQDLSYEEEYWFSVSANGPDGAKGRRAFAIVKEPGTWDCLITKDVAVGDLISPPLGTVFDCQDYEDLNVQVELINMAMDDMTNIIISYEFNGEPAVTETYTGVLPSGESMVYEFSSTLSVPATGVYEMTTWIETDGDQNDDNNMLTGTTALIPANTMPAGELVDLDEYSDCATDPDCEEVECDVDDHLVNLQNTLNDDIDWRVQGGLTPTPFTGPLGDHTTGTTGKYLYLEASGDCMERRAILTTSCIDLGGSSAPALTFWYSMNGADMGSLHVDIVSEGVLHKDVIDPVVGDQGYDWQQAMVDLSPFAGQFVSVRFRGITGIGELSDMAIDDLMITEMTGMKEDRTSTGFTVYPNPSKGIYQVTADETFNGKIDLRVVDLSGRTVYEHSFESMQEGSMLTIDISDLGNGMYYILVEGDNYQYKEKLLKY